MSRFFRQLGDSDSDSDTESSDEELLISDDEDAVSSKVPPKVVSKPTGMARFLRTAGSDSSSSDMSSDEDEDSDLSDAADTRKVPRSLGSDSEEDSDDDEIKNVVKSTKDKRLEEIEATGKGLDNALKINDWVTISNGVC